MAEELRILYEDPYLVVCVKPVGVLSEDSENGRSLPRMLAVIADRRTLQFKHHAAVGVDFPEWRIAVQIKRQLIVGNLNLFFMFHTEFFLDFPKIHRAVEPVARVTIVLVMVRLCIV